MTHYRNLAELLAYRVAQTPDAKALTHLDTRLTWQELYDRAKAIAVTLKDRGVKRGDVVGILAPHCLAQPAALFGITMADAVFSILNPLLKPTQVRHQIDDAKMRALIGTPARRAELAEIWEESSPEWLNIEMDGTLSDGPSADWASRPITTDNIPVDVANIIYTSGSTGRPKGVVVPHRTLIDGARIVSTYLGITSEDITTSILPLSFDYGLNQLMTTVHAGASLVMHNYLMPGDLLKMMEREKVTGLAAVPTLWPGLLGQLRRQKRKPDLSNLRYITTAGGAHAPKLLRQIDDAFEGTQVIVMYGLTESFRSAYLPYEEVHKRPRCIGRAVPEVELRVMDEDGNICPPGVKGELVHRGAFITHGYLNNPDMTAKRFIELPGMGPGCIPEKAVRSGDLVSMDEDGFITFYGRMDAQIKCRGYRVSPDEVAEAALSVEGVRQAAVYGIPNERVGEAIILAYETHSGEPLPQEAFTEGMAKTLPGYAIPQAFNFHAQLPSNPNGKVDMTRLRRESLSQ